MSLLLLPAIVDALDPRDWNLAVAGRIGLLRAKVAGLEREWTSELNDDRLPVLFVIDVLEALQNDFVTPFRRLQLEMLADQRNVFSTRAIGAAADYGYHLWAKVLVPFERTAREYQRQGRTIIAVAAPRELGNMGFRHYVLEVMRDYIAGFEALAKITSLQPWYTKLGALTTGWMKAADLSYRMIQQAKAVIASAGAIVYKPLAAAASILESMVKLSLIGGVAYVAWKLWGKKGRARGDR